MRQVKHPRTKYAPREPAAVKGPGTIFTLKGGKMSQFHRHNFHPEGRKNEPVPSQPFPHYQGISSAILPTRQVGVLQHSQLMGYE
jgi:hypothetical protein